MERIEWVEMTMLTNSRRRTTVTSVQPPVSCGRVAVDDIAVVHYMKESLMSTKWPRLEVRIPRGCFEWETAVSERGLVQAV